MSQINHGGAQLAEAVKRAYELGQDDYHLEPMVLTENGVLGCGAGSAFLYLAAADGLYTISDSGKATLGMTALDSTQMLDTRPTSSICP